MLTSLWEKKLFLQRLEEPGWYHYHGLFAEMLQAQLGEQFPTEVADLHHRAADWFSAENAPADTIHHLLASKAWEDAAPMIESVAFKELEQSGEGPRLLRWLQQLPEPVLREYETLLLIYLRLAMLSLSSNEVARIIASMGGQTTSAPSSAPTDDTREILSSIRHIHRTWVSDNKSRSKSTVNRRQDTIHRMMDNILQFERDYRRDLAQAELKASAVYKTARSRNHLYCLLISGGAYAKLLFSQGHLRQAEQIAHQVLRQSIELSGKLPELASTALTALSWVYFERNQFAQVHQLLERAIEVNPNPISSNESLTLAILRARVQSLQGDANAAVATVQAARELQAQHPSNMWLDQDLLAYQALFHLHHGDLDSAEQLLQDGLDIEMHPFSAFVHASILENQNRYVAAEDILSHLLNRYPHGFYGFPILRVQAKLSLILFDQHKVNQASQVMAEAARLAAPEYFIRPFLVSGPKAASLLSLVLHTENLNPGTRSFLKGLLTMLGYAEGLQNILPRDESVALNIAASITPREQQMLRLLSASLSNQEIAELCSIAPSTVKTHLENIYRKLGVNNRMQAIEQARMLNLV